MSMVQENISIPSRGGKSLQGLIRKPKGSGPFPVVIFVHGLGMTMHEWKNSFDEISERLTAEGFATLQFNFDISKDSEVRELPLRKRAKQLNDVTEWLVRESFVDTSRIGLLAQSYGVATALSSNVKPIKSMIFVGGTYNLEEAITRVYRELGVKINYGGDTTLPESSGEHTTVDKCFWQDAKKFSSKLQAKLIKTQSVFVIHGDGDTKISPSDAKDFYNTLHTKNKKLKIFIGGDHGITDVPRPMREELLALVTDWFSKTL